MAQTTIIHYQVQETLIQRGVMPHFCKTLKIQGLIKLINNKIVNKKKCPNKWSLMIIDRIQIYKIQKPNHKFLRKFQMMK